MDYIVYDKANKFLEPIQAKITELLTVTHKLKVEPKDFENGY